jgi:hypothetical protein
VLFLGDRLGDDAFDAATRAGAATIVLPAGEGRLIRAPLLSVLLVRTEQFDRTYLLVGFTSGNLLVRAGSDLLASVHSALPRCGPSCPPPPGGTR